MMLLHIFMLRLGEAVFVIKMIYMSLKDLLTAKIQYNMHVNPATELCRRIWNGLSELAIEDDSHRQETDGVINMYRELGINLDSDKLDVLFGMLPLRPYMYALRESERSEIRAYVQNELRVEAKSSSDPDEERQEILNRFLDCVFEPLSPYSEYDNSDPDEEMQKTTYRGVWDWVFEPLSQSFEYYNSDPEDDKEDMPKIAISGSWDLVSRLILAYRPYSPEEHSRALRKRLRTQIDIIIEQKRALKESLYNEDFVPNQQVDANPEVEVGDQQVEANPELERGDQQVAANPELEGGNQQLEADPEVEGGNSEQDDSDTQENMHHICGQNQPEDKDLEIELLEDYVFVSVLEICQKKLSATRASNF